MINSRFVYVCNNTGTRFYFVLSLRRGAYEFWKENYEAEKNYSEFLGILENL